MVRQAHHERLNLMALTPERGNQKKIVYNDDSWLFAASADGFRLSPLPILHFAYLPRLRGLYGKWMILFYLPKSLPQYINPIRQQCFMSFCNVDGKKVSSAFEFVTTIVGHLQRLLMGFGYRLYPSYILPVYPGYTG
jgi:hypothetical protein